jgi:hypothetical protein
MGYLFKFLKSDHAYLPNWQELRRRRKQFWMAFLLFIPFMMVIGGVSQIVQQSLSGRLAEGFFAIAGISYTGLIIWLSFRLAYWPCPRCGRPFSLSWWRRAAMNDRCLHCDLPRYAPCDSATQQWEFESHGS